MKSAHRDIALWRFDSPIRSLWGLHMRADSPEARRVLAEKLITVPQGQTHHLHFGTVLTTDDLGLPPQEKLHITDIVLQRGDHLPDPGPPSRLTLTDDAWMGLIDMLANVEKGAESSVEVLTPSGHQPLWLWWDP